MSRLICVEDYRLRAKRRLPRAIFDFVDGAAGDEVTMRANEAAFDAVTFRPRPMVDVSGIELETKVLGHEVKLPVLLGPAGATRLVHPDGEIAVARAAARAGTVYALSTGATCSIEEVAEAGRGAMLWFQVYLWRDRDLVGSLVDRARSAGYHALCLTVDTAGRGRKYRDLRNGFEYPVRMTPGMVVNAALHPRWAYNFVFGPSMRLANVVEGEDGSSVTIWRGPQVMDSRNKGGATWDELRWLRTIWDGPLVVKGILTRDAAATAFDMGADAVVCSNHGGRSLDGGPASLCALPEILEVADVRGKEVYLDGGVRRGSDVVKAMSMGARACLIARPYHWGLAVAGDVGVSRVLALLKAEIEGVLGAIGRPSVSGLDRSAINVPPLLGNGLPPTKRDGSMHHQYGGC